MITITAKIGSAGSGGRINSIESNLFGNNISKPISDISGKRSVNVGNPFILGGSKLGSGATYADNLPYFMGAQLSDSDGNFSTPYTITISGSNISSLIIAFDTTNGAFPKSITVDGNTIVDDDPVWEINCDNADSHSIVISNWNKTNSPLIITSVYSNIDIEIDKSNLISFDGEIMDRSDIQYPVFGIISNKASLVVSDSNEQILDLIGQRLLNSGSQVNVWMNNTSAEIETQIVSMRIKELTYDNYSREVSMQLTDGLEDLQDINFPAINYDPSAPKTETARYFYNKLYTMTTGLGYSFEPLDIETAKKLNNTVIQYPLLYSSSLWDEWDKLCQLCLLHFYKNNKGKIVVKYLL